MTAVVELLHPRREHLSMLVNLFSVISADPHVVHFHPHPFTDVEADRICGYSGLDCYLALKVNDRFLAYGMLRGWDDGFAVPSLGIYVAAELRGTGAARLLMQHLHLVARLSGAKQVRLKVYPENTPACRLYQSMGYVLSDPEKSVQLVGVLSL